jgi:hypothetical protein
VRQFDGPLHVDRLGCNHQSEFASAIENVLRLVAVPDKWGSRIPNWRTTVVLQSPNLRRPTILRHASWAAVLLISQGGATAAITTDPEIAVMCRFRILGGEVSIRMSLG